MNTRPAAILIAALALTLVGCDDKKPTPPAAPTKETKPSAPAAKPEEAKPSAPKEAPKEAPKPADPKAAAPTAATAKGALDLFVASMRSGDWEKALGTLDPASEGFKELNELNEGLKKNPNLTPEILGTVKGFFTAPYATMTVEDLKEQGEQARATLKAKDREPMVVDLNKLDGQWHIIAPKGIMQGDAKSLPGQPPAPPATPAGGAPAPAPAHAPAGGAPATPPKTGNEPK